MILAYGCLESWARYRFDLQNTVFPSRLRANMGLNRYEAFRLKPDRRARSRAGIEYRTDELGYRVGSRISTANVSLLLGGDSRVFGLGLPYELTVAGLLETGGLRVRQQALPGGSPAFFEHDLFRVGQLARMDPRPRWALYAFERDDPGDDAIFLAEIARRYPWTSSRRVKLALGGYFWNMLHIKANSFMARGSYQPPGGLRDLAQGFFLKHEEAQESPAASLPTSGFSMGASAAVLERTFAACRERGLRPALLYLPRLDELASSDSARIRAVRAWAAATGTDLLDGYLAFDNRCHGDGLLAARYFADAEEGIHYNAEGCALVAGLIREYIAAHP